MSDIRMTREQLNVARIKRQLADGAPRAVQRLFALLDSDNEAIAMQAARAILDYQIAKPKEAQKVDVQVTSTTAAQLAALAAKVNPLNSLPIPDMSGKWDINHGPIIDGEAVPVTVDSVADSASRKG